MALDLMRGVTGRLGAVSLFADVAAGMEQQQDEWIAELRAAGVKAAHPDDGWVDRQANTVYFCYPQFYKRNWLYRSSARTAANRRCSLLVEFRGPVEESVMFRVPHKKLDMPLSCATLESW